VFVSNECLIRFSHKAGCAPIEILRRKKAVYGDCCTDLQKMSASGPGVPKSCCAGAMSVLDVRKSGRPISVTRDENQCIVDAMIQEDRRIKQTLL